MEKVTSFHLPLGRTEVIQKIADCQIEMCQSGPLVELIASTDIDPAILLAPEKRLMATTLAFRMDPKAAIELSERIRALARTKGWPLPQ